MAGAPTKEKTISQSVANVSFYFQIYGRALHFKDQKALFYVVDHHPISFHFVTDDSLDNIWCSGVNFFNDTMVAQQARLIKDLH